MGKLTHWAVAFTVIAVFAALLGFGEVAGPGAPVARVLFWISVGVIGLSVVGFFVRRT
jgi:uncharacterized membrane protein YtjA (UPF0391 family)